MTPDHRSTGDRPCKPGVVRSETVSATPGSSTESAPIDTRVLLNRCMGHLSFAQSLLTELEHSGNEQVEAIVRHAAEGDVAAVRGVAHSLKGGAATVGAEPLRRLASEIEVAVSNPDPAVLLNLVRDLRSEMDRCLQFIPLFKASTSRAPRPPSGPELDADDGRTGR